MHDRAVSFTLGMKEWDFFLKKPPNQNPNKKLDQKTPKKPKTHKNQPTKQN